MIAAPGGSGAFREMLKALLATRAPGVEEEVAAPVASPTATPPVAAEKPRESNALREAEPLAAVQPSGTGVAMPADADSAPPAPVTTVNPVSLAAAVAAVAPALPPEHRKSLAVVFRALAEALEG